MKTIILSGFGTFGNYPANTSEIVARALHAHTLGNYCVRSEIFPATIPSNNRAQLLREKARWTTIRGDKVHAIVSLGMSSSARGLTIETLAQNRVDDTRYCTLDQIGTLVDSRRPRDEVIPIHLGRWNIQHFQTRCVHENLPTALNTTVSGSFCCNHLMYQMCVFQKSETIPWIFIHLPCVTESVPGSLDEFTKSEKIVMPQEEIIAGLELLVENATL